MKKILHFILSHSVFIAICAAALSLQTLQLLHFPCNIYLIIFIFFAALCGYNAYWLLSKFSFNPQTSLLLFLKKQLIYFIISFLAMAGMIYCLLHLHLIWYNVVITFFLMLVYSVPLLPFKQINFTRKAGFVKTILLSFTWAHVTTMIPLQITITHLTIAEILIYISRFLFILMLCIIFDKRDMAMDQIRGMHSLATDVSAKTLHYSMIVIFMLFSIIGISLVKFGIEYLQSIGLLITAIATFILYLYSLKKRGYFFYYFLVDGLMLFSVFITYLLSI